MKKKIFILLLLPIIFPVLAEAQCREYIEAIAPDKITPYVLDANFYSAVVYEGDKISFSKSFIQGQKYKIEVVGMDIFEKKITIYDEDEFIVFKNYQIKKKEDPQVYTDHNGNKVDCIGSNSWEFEVEESKNYKIEVQIEKKAKKKKQRLRGCMGVLIGFM